MLPMLAGLLPRQLREMGQQLRTLNRQKEIAILEEDYESAATWRDQANALGKRMEEFADEWEEKMNEEEVLDSPRDLLLEITLLLISEIETAMDALISGDIEKIAETKERLRALKSQLSGNLAEPKAAKLREGEALSDEA